MKGIWMMPALLALSADGWAQAGALYNAQLSESTSLTNPARGAAGGGGTMAGKRSTFARGFEG